MLAGKLELGFEANNWNFLTFAILIANLAG